MRGIISPFVVVALLIVTFALYIEYLKLSEINHNINEETKLDIKNHEKILNNIAKVARIKHNIYTCAEFYNCTNLTEFITNVSNCAGTQIYFDGNFYFMYTNHKFELNRMGCGVWTR